MLGDAIQSLEAFEGPLVARVGESGGVKAKVNVPGGQGSKAVTDGMVALPTAAELSHPLDEVKVGRWQGQPVGTKVLEAEGVVLLANRIVLVARACTEAMEEEGSCMRQAAKEPGEGRGGKRGCCGLGEGAWENSVRGRAPET